MSLSRYEEDYEQIMRSPVGLARERALNQLMNRMKDEYHIPSAQTPEWENEHQAVIALYRKIRMSRTNV